MKFDLSQSGLKTVITAGIVALVAIGIVLNWAEPVSAQNAAPAKPDTPTLRALHKGMVEVDWNDVSGANRYEVQFYMSSGWTDMPDAGLGIEIFFYGSRAVATGLPEDLSYDAFHVRAGNSVGWSEWSEYTWQMTTHNMDWEGVPVPAIEEEPPAPTNTPATGVPSISGTSQVGETLTADTSGIADDDGLTNVSYGYQWARNDGTDDSDISGATSRTYTLVEADQGKTIKVKVSFTDDADNDETLTSAATGEVEALPNWPATGGPTISGTAQVREPLTAETSGIADDDGLSGATFSYQWIANDGTSDTDITGATDSSYTLVAADESKTIKVRVSFTDDAGNEETLTSTATETVSFAVQQQASNNPATGAPTISGTARAGRTLTVDTSNISDGDGMVNVTFGYQWISNDGTTDTDITDETSSTYTIKPWDLGKYIKARVSFTDDAGNEETLTSSATTTVAASPDQAPTGGPIISGMAEVGQSLYAVVMGIRDGNGMTYATFSYQWIRNDGTTDSDIPGATGTPYTLTDTDEGKTIKVRVSFTDDGANAETLTSAATGAVAAAPSSYITVAVTEDSSDSDNIITNFTVTWSDSDDCSTNYNAYLHIRPGTRPGHETPGTQLHLGSAASGGAQIAKGLSDVQVPVQGFEVKLYCGTDGSGRLVSRVGISYDRADSGVLRPRPGTYSSEPKLIALSVSQGTLTPTFNSYTYRYPVPDVANADTRITITATPKTGYYVDFYEASEDAFVGGIYVRSRPLHGLSAECKRQRSYSDGGGPLVELTDADPDTPGFQVDLYDGDNYVHLRVHSIANCDLGTGYSLPITRPEGSLSLPRPNRPPTGLPIVSPRYDLGPYVGLTMIADASKIRDRDGRTNATFSYQWLADDTEITGATGSSYTVADTDLGKTLKVRGSFTDDRGTEESVTSVATKVVKLRNFDPSGKPIIVGFLRVGQTLSADVSGIHDSNGLTDATFRYEWVNFRGPVRDGEEYTLVDGDAGHSSRWMWVYYTDDAGHEERVTSDYVGDVAPRSDSAATGAPTISGTAQVGETLTADTSGIADDDGLTNVFSHGYQWIRTTGQRARHITSATDSTYTLVAADEGETIRVKVVFTDDAGNLETRTSAATSSVAARPNSPGTGAPTISGTAQVGETLTADTSGIAGTGGLMIGYRWIRNDGTSDTGILHATDSTYTLVAADEGKTIKVKVSLTDNAGNVETLTSTATSVVAARHNSAATGAPTITGNVHVRERLTADTSGIADADGLTNVAYSYQWIANDGTSDTDITGATASTYILHPAYEGKTIKVRVSFTDDATNEESLTSEATAEVAAAGPRGDITVVVTEDASDSNVTNFTVTWSDAGDCSTNYNAYLHINPHTRPGYETPESILHLGSAASDEAQITKGLSDIQGNIEGFGVTLYCGTDGSGRLVRGIAIAGMYQPRPGTYSSVPPLIVLSVSHGTLTPTFNRYTYRYSVPDVANADTRITITATPETGHYVDFYELSEEPGERSGGVLTGLIMSGALDGISPDCKSRRSFFDSGGPLVELTDADPDTPGFQVDLYDGGNYVQVRVPSIAFCDYGTAYTLAITRAEGSLSLPRPNRPPTGLPIFSGYFPDGLEVGDSIYADVSTIRDRDGLVPGNWILDRDLTFLPSAALSFQWLADDAEITGATGSSYTVTAAELGKTLKVRVSFTDDRGTEESVTSVATKVVKLRNRDPIGKPIIVGTLEVGQALKADVSGISDPNGMTNATFSYEWVNFHGPVRDGEEYTLVDGDGGRCGCWLWVHYTDDAGHEERVSSDYVGDVAPPSNSAATGAPSISGTPQVGETLTVDTMGIADADGLSGATFSYQWIRNDGSSDTDIRDAADSSYTLVAADDGKTIKVRVSFTDDAANEETLTSTATEAVSFAVQQQITNSPATGAPAATGTVQVGETLTADTTGIADADGLSGATFRYQWIRSDGSSDADITDATDSTYTLAADDEGKTIKVRVSFTDDDGYAESLTSAATETVTFAVQQQIANSPATGAPSITGTAQVGETLTADTSNIADDDGLTGATFAYQWLADDTEIASANEGTYVLTSNEMDKTIKVRVSFTDDGGNEETLTSAATGAVSPAVQQQQASNTPATGAPTISGTAQVGETLTASTSGIADADGLSGAAFSYQWTRNDGNLDTDIQNATGTSYTLTAADVGKTIKVRVSFTDNAGNAETLTSAATAAVAARPAPGTAPDTPDKPTGTAVFVGGEDLEWNDVLGADSYAVHLYRNGQWVDLPGDGVEIAFYGAGAIISDLDPDSTLWFQVRAKNAHGSSEWSDFSSMASTSQFKLGRRDRPANVPASGAPVINGTAQAGETLTADTTGIEDGNGLDRVQFRVQWGSHDGSADKDIASATDSTYTLAASDEGKTIKVRVAFTDRGGYAESLTSAATATVAAAPNSPATGAPAVTGTAQVGETLTADTSGIADADRLTNVSYSYQWIPNDGNSNTDNQDATDSTYTLVEADQGKTIKVKVTFTDDAGNGESLTSAATAEVAARPNTPATGTPTISGTAQVGETLTADTSGIADADGLTNVSYSYQWIPNDGSFDTDNQDAPGSTYTLADSDEGKTIKVEVSFTDDAGNGESLTSAATATVASSNPAAGICDRTEQVQDAILGMLNGVVDDCADVTDSHLAGITIGLRISNDPYDRPALSLKSGDFAGLVNIEVLAIYYHTMDALPEDIFEGLTGLNHLYLVENQLGALPEGVFNGLGSLERLDLRGNQLGALPEGVFNGLGNLESLDLRGNQIGTLPEGVFDGLGSLTYLELFGNRINALPEDVFDGLGNLTYLGLSFNQLSALPDDVFDDLGNLEQLYLFKNQLGTLPEGVFNGLSSLERLNLSYNEIAALPEDVFDGLGNLKSLRLDSNDLASPPEDVFDGLDSLTHLTLSHNRIHTLPEDVFEGLGNLTSLGLGNNQINVLPEDVFDELGNLTSLGLGGNQLGALPEGVFDELGNLTSLDLGNNRIGRLAEDFFDELGNLTSLDLSGNRLGAVPEGFFDELGNLTYLSLYRNQIRALPEDVFEGLGNLTSLNLHANQISVLPEDVFDGLGNLNKLYLNENQLSALPEDVFDGLSNLNELYLFENQLSALPEDVFDGLSNLNELYLYGNQISALPEDVFDGLSNLNGLYLWGNPGTPFTLTTDLERQGDNAVLVKVAEGVPFDMAVTLSATGGTLSAASVTIKGGTADSEAVTVTRSGDGPVTVSVVSAVFQAGDYNGIQAGLGEPLILGDAEGDNRPATGTPAISGIAQVGETLTADTAGIADADGLTNVTYSYQWIVNDGTADTDIADATDSTYTLVAAAEGKTIKVRVSFTDDADNDETLTSAATGEVEALPNRPATGAPTISGTAQVGETLTADTSSIADDDGLNNVTYSYQWLGDDTDIAGATSSTYTLAETNEGQTIKVKVSFADDADNRETLTSAATAVVATPEPPAKPTGLSPVVISHDTVTLAWDNPQDDSITGYVILRRDRAIHPVRTFVTITGDTGSADTTYTDDTVEPDKQYVYRIKAINEHGEVSEESDWVRADTPAVPVPDKPTGLSAAVSHDTVTLTWDDPQDDSITGYVILRRDREIHLVGTFVTITGDTGSAQTTYTDETVEPDKEYVYRIKAINEHGEVSERSDWVRGFTPAAPPTDSPATGEPTITGTAQVGEMLTVDTSRIADDDGLVNATYTYQWVANDGTTDTNISGATDNTYTLVDDDEGMTIKVRVTIIDDAENETTLTSAATEAVGFAVQQQGASNTPATGQPTISGTAQVGEMLTADTTGIADEDGLEDVAFSYQWLSDDAEIGGATGSTYTPVADDEGKTITVQVSFTDDGGNDETLTSTATDVVAEAARPNSPATGAPAITGTAQVGETLTADTTGIADEDGLEDVAFSYQWLSDDAEIGGATGSTYTPVADDEGKTITVQVSFTDDGGNDETLTSTATDVVAEAARPNSPATGAPAITGTAQVGETLTADTTGIADEDGLEDVAFSYQWLSDDAEIGGATGSTYTPVADDEGKTITVQVSFTDDGGNDETLTSTATDVVAEAARPNSPATGAPAITGTAQVGETLTADTTGIADEDGLEDVAFSYQWLSDDAEIGGATGSTYTPVADDEGKTIKVRVTVTDDLGNETTLTSAATEAVAAAPQPDSPATGEPTITGTAQVGQTLSVDTSGIADADGLEDVAFSYQWLSDDAGIGGATGSTYTLVDDDEGRTIKVRVTVTDDLGNETTLTSAATEAVEAKRNTAATGRPTISGTVRVGETLTADTTGIADADGLTNVSYRYQWVVTDGSAYIDISGEKGATYTLVSADRGLRILVRVSFTDDAGKRERLTSAATDVVAAAA